MADQLRYHALSSSGDENIATPNIDRLVAEGACCTAAFSQYPVCTPFRGGLMTGLHGTTSGTARHGDYLNPALKTVAHAFKNADYRTSYVGKWHLAPEMGLHLILPEQWIGQDFWVHPGFRGGFEDWFGFNVSNNYYQTYITTGEKIEPEKLDGYQTDALTDISLQYLAARPADEAWFHVVSYESPHPGAGGNPRSRSYPVPEAYESRFEPEDIRLRPNVPAEQQEDAREQLAGYYRLIANLDDNVGRLLDYLDASGQTENTLVVFFSDHGEMGGSQGLRNKQVPFEESLHIPLVWRLPGVIPAGSTYTHPVCGLDIYPTSAGFCGITPAAACQGLDYSGVLTQNRDEALRDAVLVQWEDTRFSFGNHPYRALRSNRYTYCVSQEDALCCLFDHQDDPFELKNRFEEPESHSLRQDLHARLQQLVLDAGETVPDYVHKHAP